MTAAGPQRQSVRSLPLPHQRPAISRPFCARARGVGPGGRRASGQLAGSYGQHGARRATDDLLGHAAHQRVRLAQYDRACPRPRSRSRHSRRARRWSWQDRPIRNSCERWRCPRSALGSRTWLNCSCALLLNHCKNGCSVVPTPVISASGASIGGGVHTCSKSTLAENFAANSCACWSTGVPAGDRSMGTKILRIDSMGVLLPSAESKADHDSASGASEARSGPRLLARCGPSAPRPTAGSGS